jgi:hypothetical protein
MLQMEIREEENMRKGKIRICVLLVSICVLTAFRCDAESPGKTKMLVGGMMMGAGMGLSAHAWDRCSFGPGTDNCGEAEFLIGQGMFWGGTVVLILGIYDHHHSKHQGILQTNDPVPVRRVDYLFGAGPVRKGFAGGFRLRW